MGAEFVLVCVLLIGVNFRDTMFCLDLEVLYACACCR